MEEDRSGVGGPASALVAEPTQPTQESNAPAGPARDTETSRREIIDFEPTHGLEAATVVLNQQYVGSWNTQMNTGLLTVRFAHRLMDKWIVVKVTLVKGVYHGQVVPLFCVDALKRGRELTRTSTFACARCLKIHSRQDNAAVHGSTCEHELMCDLLRRGGM